MNTEFNKKLLESYQSYATSDKDGARSNAKLKPVHGYIASSINNKTNGEYHILAQGFGEDKEKTVNGTYYNKNVDITVSKLNNGIEKDIAGVEVKIFASSIGKNSVNYIENCMGATANLQSDGFSVAQFVVAPTYSTWYNKQGILTKVEHLSEHNIRKYFNLDTINMNNAYHKPNLLYFGLIDTGNYSFLMQNIGKKLDKTALLNSYNITSANYDNLPYTPEIKDWLKKRGDYDNFINAFCGLVKYKEYQ